MMPDFKSRRDASGRYAREVWISSARLQPEPNPADLVPYDELNEEVREQYRCVGSALWADGFAEGLIVANTVSKALEQADGNDPH